MLASPVKVIENIKHMRQLRRQLVEPVGFVPTMGYLHEGHLSLVRQAKIENPSVVVSIFVNPTQFGPQEDFQSYPRDTQRDLAMLEGMTDVVFMPSAAEMYPAKFDSWVEVGEITERLEGASRPGHFRGVTTIVAKLFNIVQPDVAYFGQKDAQQLAIIKRMVADLNFPVEIRPCPTVRETDGLAWSSRNQYLNDSQRRQAPCLYEALQHAARLVAAGRCSSDEIIAAMAEVIKRRPEARIDYISIVDTELLQPVERVDRPCLIALAVHIGPARLIDNILVEPPEKTK